MFQAAHYHLTAGIFRHETSWRPLREYREAQLFPVVGLAFNRSRGWRKMRISLLTLPSDSGFKRLGFNIYA